MAQETLTYYFDRYAQGTLNADEREVFVQMLRDPANTEAVQQILDQDWPQWEQLPLEFPDAIKRIEEGVAAAISRENNTETIPAVHRVPSLTGGRRFFKTTWFKYAAAILLITGISTYLWNNIRRERTHTVSNQPIKKDILPGSQRARLTLADGSTIILDSAANGQLATQGNSKVIKLDNGQLVYSAKPPIPSHGGVAPGGAGVGSVQQLSTNTMSTPRGGQYQLTLSDGTRVWLNAASSITYPTTFTEKTREVSITGEAYFEVKQDKSKPFFVRTPKELISVLGTSFNVNVYTDEPISKTSLIEGSVLISPAEGRSTPPKAGRGWILKPGQALLNNKIISTNIQQDIAWKNGGFDFNDMDLASALRQLSRWYNIDIVYEGKIPQKKLWGGVGRDLNLSQVLILLSNLGIKTKLTGNTLTILSQ
ncbi:MAG: FecR family protein [Chitinophagaceae bacterium]|nr:FecR family protein [Chitinophagaceae bacterium]